MTCIRPGDCAVCQESIRDPRLDLKAFYDRLVADGKAKKLALIALMRKLIILLNHLLKKPKFKLA